MPKITEVKEETTKKFADQTTVDLIVGRSGQLRALIESIPPAALTAEISVSDLGKQKADAEALLARAEGIKVDESDFEEAVKVAKELEEKFLYIENALETNDFGQPTVEESEEGEEEEESEEEEEEVSDTPELVAAKQAFVENEQKLQKLYESLENETVEPDSELGTKLEEIAAFIEQTNKVNLNKNTHTQDQLNGFAKKASALHQELDQIFKKRQAEVLEAVTSFEESSAAPLPATMPAAVAGKSTEAKGLPATTPAPQRKVTPAPTRQPATTPAAGKGNPAEAPDVLIKEEKAPTNTPETVEKSTESKGPTVAATTVPTVVKNEEAPGTTAPTTASVVRTAGTGTGHMWARRPEIQIKKAEAQNFLGRMGELVNGDTTSWFTANCNGDGANTQLVLTPKAKDTAMSEPLVPYCVEIDIPENNQLKIATKDFQQVQPDKTHYVEEQRLISIANNFAIAFMVAGMDQNALQIDVKKGGLITDTNQAEFIGKLKVAGFKRILVDGEEVHNELVKNASSGASVTAKIPDSFEGYGVPPSTPSM